MSISPTSGPVSTLVPDASQPRTTTAPQPEQDTANQTAAPQAPSQAVTSTSTETGVDSESRHEHRVDVTV